MERSTSLQIWSQIMMYKQELKQRRPVSIDQDEYKYTRCVRIKFLYSSRTEYLSIIFLQKNMHFRPSLCPLRNPINEKKSKFWLCLQIWFSLSFNLIYFNHFLVKGILRSRNSSYYPFHPLSLYSNKACTFLMIVLHGINFQFFNV